MRKTARRLLQLAPSFLFTLLCASSAFGQSHTASLSWAPAQQPDGITVASWNVLRGDVTGGPYTQIGNVPLDTTTYTDNQVSSGQTYYYVVQSVDTAGDVSANSSEAQAVIPTSAPPLSVSTTNLPPASVGTSYSATITASGGTGPYAWSGTGVDGLTFSSTGMLSGTPSQSGTFTQNVMVTDSTGATASAALQLTVQDPPAPLAITTTSLPGGFAKTSYSTALTASGGTAPYTWSGVAVDGLAVSSTGAFSGTPAQAGTFTVAISVTDSAGAAASASLQLTVVDQPTPVAPVLSLEIRTYSDRLTWVPQQQPVGETLARWRIFRSTDGVTFVLIAHVSASATVYRDTNVVSGQTYYYEIEAANTEGEVSPYSNVVEGTRP